MAEIPKEWKREKNLIKNSNFFETNYKNDGKIPLDHFFFN